MRFNYYSLLCLGALAEIQKNINKGGVTVKRGKWLLGALLLVAVIFSYPYFNQGMKLPDEVKAHPLYAVYEANFEQTPLMGAVTDLNDDGQEDILVVFSYDKERNKIIAILAGDTPHITKMEPAPLEHVVIEFKDIDKKPPTEFILSGSKGSYVGYGIYRIQDEEIFNIFSADMEDCC